MAALKIGQIATGAGVSVETVRFTSARACWSSPHGVRPATANIRRRSSGRFGLSSVHRRLGLR